MFGFAFPTCLIVDQAMTTLRSDGGYTRRQTPPVCKCEAQWFTNILTGPTILIGYLEKTSRIIGNMQNV